MYRTGKSMNNLLSYCWLVFARISASEKDLPVHAVYTKLFFVLTFRTIYVHNLSYCRLVDARISASEKDLPVQR